MKKKSFGIVLLQIGGPDCLEDVPHFLYNLFADRDIIRLGPAFLQKPLAWFIARRRAPKSQKNYAKIGGGSPLKKITIAQKKMLEQVLCDDADIHIAIAMRYWPPSADDAIKALVAQKVTHILALPLYPHYTQATTGSSLKDLRRAHALFAPEIPLQEITSWPDHPPYIEALAHRVTAGHEIFAGEPFTLVYSAHSLPVSFIKGGDPYVRELEKTITALEKRTGIKGRLCYQSRSGPVEWLSPSTPETIKQLAKEGCKNILMMPISFVSDHIETLYEIDMEFKEIAEDLGMRLVSTAPLNDDPDFVTGLATLLRNHIAEFTGE